MLTPNALELAPGFNTFDIDGLTVFNGGGSYSQIGLKNNVGISIDAPETSLTAANFRIVP